MLKGPNSWVRTLALPLTRLSSLCLRFFICETKTVAVTTASDCWGNCVSMYTALPSSTTSTVHKLAAVGGFGFNMNKITKISSSPTGGEQVGGDEIAGSVARSPAGSGRRSRPRAANGNLSAAGGRPAVPVFSLGTGGISSDYPA